MKDTYLIFWNGLAQLDFGVGVSLPFVSNASKREHSVHNLLPHYFFPCSNGTNSLLTFTTQGTTPLALAAGFLYGIPIGFVTVTIGSVGGATCRCTSLQHCLTEGMQWHFGSVRGIWLSGWQARSSPIRDFLLSWKQWKNTASNFAFLCGICVTMSWSYNLSLSPIPFGLQNSLFAVSRVLASSHRLSLQISKISFFNYFAASFLGLFPEQLM